MVMEKCFFLQHHTLALTGSHTHLQDIWNRKDIYAMSDALFSEKHKKYFRTQNLLHVIGSGDNRKRSYSGFPFYLRRYTPHPKIPYLIKLHTNRC